MSCVEEKEVLDGQALNVLYSWIDVAPLTRPKRNIARDFSDGVLVAEIIHHYVPRAVDMHNYVVANSTGQKRINWNTLNRKVFSKLGIKLTETILNHVVEAKPGAIEQILWDLRSKILEHALTPEPAVPGKNKILREPEFLAGKYLAQSLGRAQSKKMPTTPSNLKIQSSVKSQLGLHQVPSATNKGFKATPSSARLERESLKKLPSAHQALKPATAVSAVPAAIRKAVIPDEPERPKEAKSKLSFAGDRDSETELGENQFPSQIVYKGNKMVAVELLELKDQEIKKLENEVRQKLIKIDRLDKLIKIKDDRIDDLSHELQNVRSMYEQVTLRPRRMDENGNMEHHAIQ